MSKHKILFVFRLTTYMNPQRTAEYLAYLGYMYDHDSQVSALHSESTGSLVKCSFAEA